MARMRRVASSPSMPGILMSISTTSGRCLRDWATASAPSAVARRLADREVRFPPDFQPVTGDAEGMTPSVQTASA
jgi:hypothetical protein